MYIQNANRIYLNHPAYLKINLSSTCPFIKNNLDLDVFFLFFEPLICKLLPYVNVFPDDFLLFKSVSKAAEQDNNSSECYSTDLFHLL
jgi:hypothetical protein